MRSYYSSDDFRPKIALGHYKNLDKLEEYLKQTENEEFKTNPYSSPFSTARRKSSATASEVLTETPKSNTNTTGRTPRSPPSSARRNPKRLQTDEKSKQKPVPIDSGANGTPIATLR